MFLYNEIVHELGIARNVLEIIIGEADQRGGRAKSVLLRVGQISGIVPESLEFLIKCLSEGTPAEGLEVKIEIVKPVMVCKSCGEKFTVEELSFYCPKCGGGDCETIEGKDLVIETITLEGDNGP